MSDRVRLAWAVVGAALGMLVAGCAGDDAHGGAPAEPEVAIGTGGIDRYVPIQDGDTVLMARGCQGGQHVWIGVRARGLNTEPALVSLSGIRVRDAAMVSIPFTVRLHFVQDVEDGWDEVNGIQLVIPFADQAIEEDIDIHARVVEDSDGGQAVEATRRVHVVWGDEVCGGALADGGRGDASDGGLDGASDGGLDDGGTDAGVPADGAASDAAD